MFEPVQDGSLVPGKQVAGSLPLDEVGDQVLLWDGHAGKRIAADLYQWLNSV